MSMDGTSEPGAPSGNSTGSQLPWHLIPHFSPGETDLTEYARRLEFLAGIWPSEYLNQLAPRAALQCKGSAFQKVVRLDTEKLKVNSLDGVKLLVTTLGGVWGKTVLEDKYEKFERAIFGISQKSDETNESYLARHEVLFEDLISQGATLSDMRAYILLRNSALVSEDKKRVVIEAQGHLKYEEVTKAIRMLGAKFFQEVQGNVKQSRTKTYDVNHVEGDEEVFYGEEVQYGFSVENADVSEYAMEQFLSENDEDALVVQQFEDALIDTIQSDGEMNAFMNSYVEARRKLTEKAKFRGFWPVRSKGGGKKGKSKGFNARGRKPLAVRIAESECRLCGQKGHWKAERPRKSQNATTGSSLGSRTQPTNMMISATDADDDEADVFLVESLVHDASDVLQSVQDPSHVTIQSHSHDVFTCEGNNHNGDKNKLGNPRNCRFYVQVRDRLSFLCQHMGVQTPSRKNEDGTSETTPSPECWSNDSVHASADGFQVSSVQPAAPTDALLQKASMNAPETPANEQSVLFATHQTIGILDLGASQTVMGRYQVDEFLELLPEAARCRVFEQPVDMSFRFGNNSVVPCRVALMVPVDRFWIKIAVVDTKTPFLISNNVCRSLGAVIDTTNQTICFRELDCTMPLTLSGKKLFLLDFSELVSLRPPRPAESDKTPMLKAENVCSCQSEQSQFPSSVSHQDALKINTESLEVEKEMTIQPDVDRTEEANSSSHVSSDRISTSSEAVTEVLRDQSNHQPTETSNSLPCASSHVLKQPCGSLRCRSGDAEQVEQGADSDGLEHGRTPEPHHQVRNCKGRTYVQGGGRDRSKVLSVVSSPMGIQQQERASGVPVLSEHVDGTQGIREWDQWIQDWRPTASEAAAESRWQGSWCLLHGDADRSRDRRGAVGSGVPSRIPHATKDDEPHRPARECTDASRESAAKPDTACRSGPVRLTQPAQTLMIDQVVEEYIAYMSSLGKEKYPVQRSSVVSSNWVFCEMMQYFSQHGHNPGHSRSSLDVLEVYCSADSRLTSQCQQQGLRALRFGLKQGDLNTYEGRCQLYKVLQSSPKHIWTSPKCKAWCKWSQFNANRSLEAAQRVCQAQEDDEVHLLLRAALFKLQAMRGDSFHFHLEQPVGSLMLGQECLQEVMDHAHCVRCDMCTAGKLTHPNMNIPLQKGTQIVTTSSILARYIQQFRCKNDHEHVPVAGSYVKNNGTHGRLSEYTELYTRMFCQRVARTICASLQVQELSTISQDVILGSMEEFSEAAAKRRRLNSKVFQPEGYPIAPSPSVPEGNVESTSEASSSHDDSKSSKKMILDQALQLAPRVGKTVLEHGVLFDVVQQAFPDHIVRVVELCKGADRFRKSPVKLIPHEAPLRMTLGIHRHSLEPFPDSQWEQWENR